MKTKHLPGNRYGRLTLVHRIPGTRTRAARPVLECACGVTIVRAVQAVASGEIRSCGCLRRELARARSAPPVPLPAARAHRLRGCAQPGAPRRSLPQAA